MVPVTAELILDDNEGFIRYEDSETTEDNDAIIVVSVATGDVDQSETVTAIEFSEASLLNGGSLYLEWGAASSCRRQGHACLASQLT